MLIGIVVTNAIVLLDLVEQLRHKGFSTHEALIQGGRVPRAADPDDGGRDDPGADARSRSASRRARSSRPSSATVVIGGLFSSTFLTLIVVPVIYSLVDGGKEGARKRFGGSSATVEEPTAPPAAPPAGALSEG